MEGQVANVEGKTGEEVGPGTSHEKEELLRTACFEGDIDTVRSLLSKDIDVDYNPSESVHDIEGTALIRACKGAGDVRIVKLLLGSGANRYLDAEQTGTTALIECAKRPDRMECMRALCDGDYEDLDHQDDAGMTALMHAASLGFREVVEALLDMGADYDITRQDGVGALLVSYPHIQITVMLIRAGCKLEPAANGDNILLLAVRRDDIDGIRAILQAGCPADLPQGNGNTALMWAVTRESRPLFDLFIEFKADVNHRNNRGRTPLMIAARQQNIDFVKALLKNGAEAGTVNPITGHTAMSLNVTSAPDNLDMVRLLMPLTDINLCYEELQSETILMAACASLHGELINLCLEQKDIDVNICDDIGRTALTYAIMSLEGKEKSTRERCQLVLEVVDLLLGHGANINQLTDIGTAPITVAGPLIEDLVERGARLDIRTHLLPLAVQLDAAKSVKTILGLYSKHKVGLGQLLNESLDDPLRLAVESKSLSCLEVVSNYSPHISVLMSNQAMKLAAMDLENGSKMYQYFYRGRPSIEALAYAMEAGNLRCVQAAFATKANVDWVHPDFGMTALGMAVAAGREDLTKALIERGANVDAQMWFPASSKNDPKMYSSFPEPGSTALSIALSRGDVKTARLLVKHGASLRPFPPTPEGKEEFKQSATVSGAYKEARRLFSKDWKRERDQRRQRLIDVRHNTPVHCAAMQGDLDTVRKMVIHGLYRVGEQSAAGHSLHACLRFGGISTQQWHDLLHSVWFDAVRRQDFACLRTTAPLLPPEGLCVDMRDKQGRTALHYATMLGRSAVVGNLLRLGASRTATDNGGHNALDIARFTDKEVCIRLLDGTLMGRRLMEAAASGQVDTVKSLLEEPNIDVDWTDVHGNTALLMATLSGHHDTVKLLRDAGADPLLRNVRGISPASAAQEFCKTA